MMGMPDDRHKMAVARNGLGVDLLDEAGNGTFAKLRRAMRLMRIVDDHPQREERQNGESEFGDGRHVRVPRKTMEQHCQAGPEPSLKRTFSRRSPDKPVQRRAKIG